MDQTLGALFSGKSVLVHMVLKVRQEFSLRLALIHGWLYPSTPHSRTMPMSLCNQEGPGLSQQRSPASHSGERSLGLCSTILVDKFGGPAQRGSGEKGHDDK